MILYNYPKPNTYWFIYTLFLENNFYYVGMTLYPKRRIMQHCIGFGANFTNKNKPINVIELYCTNIYDRKLAYNLEKLKAREYQNKYGKNMVIGGKQLYFKKEKIKNYKKMPKFKNIENWLPISYLNTNTDKNWNQIKLL